MPIYAYKCETCGHSKDVLQKVSDEPLSTCPQCGASTFRKQVTAAGFQLKGSGWYVTDFRDGNKGAAKPAKDEAAASGGEGAKTAGSEGGGAAASDAQASTASPAAAPAPAPKADSSPPAASPPPAAS